MNKEKGSKDEKRLLDQKDDPSPCLPP